ncbi:MAG TPA: SUMF1/EgtB/PvdO family nonheme iron enzyme [Phycisphaerae bacterium]|nr:SUMF1/EgtB/PvdO family nonheme iron enzyme [Phycisphaerae bacterium]
METIETVESPEPNGAMPPPGSREDLRKIVRNAARTIALIGFPNSGKTAYLTALGKELRKPQGDQRWKIVGSSEDIFQHVNDLLVLESRDAQWNATEPTLPPKPLNLFTARRRGLWHCQTSAFDTSGEHYLAIAGGRDFPEDSPAGTYADILAKRVLPRCPGVVALIDCTVTAETLARHVSLYYVLLNRIHGFGFRHLELDPAKPFKVARPPADRLPIALALTKVDRLEGRQLILHADRCAYLRYLEQAGRDPAQAGLHGADGDVVTYAIRSEVFLNAAKHPDPAEGQAVIEDFVNGHMPALADLVQNMRLSGFYHVQLFPVSAWGKCLASTPAGAETRPEIEDIEPAGILHPQFWILERTFRIQARRRRTRMARVAMWAAAVLLILGPGLFWGLYGLGRQFHAAGRPDLAYHVVWLNNFHPFTRYVQSRWEPQAQQMLVELNFDVSMALMKAEDGDRARTLLDQARDLGADTTEIDRHEWALLSAEFAKAAEMNTTGPMWRVGRRWMRVASRLGASRLNETVTTIGEALGEKGFEDAVWLEFAKGADSYEEQINATAKAMVHRFYARYYLEKDNAGPAPPGASAEQIQALRNQFKQADAHARLSGDKALMGRTHQRWVQETRNIFMATEKLISGAIDIGEYETALKNWGKLLELAQECPTLKRELWVAGDNLVRNLQRFAAETPTPDTGNPEQIVSALGLAYKVAQNVWPAEDVRDLAALLSVKYLAHGEHVPPGEAFQSLLNLSGKFWQEARPLPEKLSIEMSDRLKKLYETGRIGPKELKRFEVSDWTVSMWSFDKHILAGEYDQALAVLSAALSAPQVQIDQAVECLRKFLAPIRQEFTRAPLPEQSIVDRLTSLGRCAAAPALAGAPGVKAALEEIALLDAHRQRVRTMVLVKADKPFYVDRSEVTVAQYRAFRQNPHLSAEMFFGGAGTMDASPVVNVTYEEAADYAQSLGKRLPTLEEYQALAEQMAKALPKPLTEEDCNVNKPRLRITPVSRVFRDSFGGVVGIAGNVREWCRKEGKAQADIWGMSWFDTWRDDWTKAPAPRPYPPEGRDDYTGFRCAVDAIPALPPTGLEAAGN